MHAEEKRSSLFCQSINDEERRFFDTDRRCQELNHSTIVEKNLTLACRHVFAGPPLPSTFMAIIQVPIARSNHLVNTLASN